MKNVKHTPGPWVATFDPRVNVKAADKKSVCALLMPAGKKTRPYEEHCANARLISAAPELLEALKIVAVHLRVNGKTPGEVKLKDFVEDTVDKATGPSDTSIDDGGAE